MLHSCIWDDSCRSTLWFSGLGSTEALVKADLLAVRQRSIWGVNVHDMIEGGGSEVVVPCSAVDSYCLKLLESRGELEEKEEEVR